MIVDAISSCYFLVVQCTHDVVFAVLTFNSCAADRPTVQKQCTCIKVHCIMTKCCVFLLPDAVL